MQTNQRASLKERQRQERENLILQIAEEVLLEKGYHETSMDEIAARVGVAKGTVYLHFPSKEELVVAIFAHGVEAFLLGVEEVMADKETNRAKLEALLHFMYTGLYRKRAQLMTTIFNSGDLHRIFVEKGGSLKDLFERQIAQATELVEAGKAAGEFTQAVPTSVLVSALFSLVSPRSFQRLTLEEGLPIEELVQYVGHIYFDGVGVSEERGIRRET
jgi:TetR/AcrR family fatty acid metabolism transcriptional regulator